MHNQLISDINKLYNTWVIALMVLSGQATDEVTDARIQMLQLCIKQLDDVLTKNLNN